MLPSDQRIPVKKPRKRGQEAEKIELTIDYSGIPVYLRASA